QDCELLGLSDLNTESDTVRARTARYLIELARLGVRGFRIDAAKHILPSSLDAIIGRMNATLAQEGRPLPYVFHEVIDYGGEAVRATDYLGVGYASNSGSDISEFKFRGVQDKFLRAGGTQRVGELAQFSESRWGLLPTDKAVVFLENHDTARDGTGNLSYRSPQLWRLAQVWILGQAYGYPSILSGYAFSRPGGRDLGPPSDGSGNTRPVACPASIDQAAPDGWVCEHRDPVVRTMVAFRRTVAGTDTRLLWDDGAMATAYSRGDRGFVAVNANATQLDRTIPTALPPGRYCDVLTGGRTGTTCAGTVVTIDAAGTATVQLAPLTALAIHSGTRL
nr:alpha amylase C-terminal domain-containing protein [Gemmatimonadaceae bacterium]